MSIFFNVSAVRELVDRIEAAQNQLDGVHNQLVVDARAAQRLLSTMGSAEPAHSAWLDQLDEVSKGLTTEHFDLATRMNNLISADARTAYALATTTGRSLNTAITTRALESGWTYDETIERHELALLDQRPRPLTRSEAQRHHHLTAKLAALDQPFTITHRTGDLDADMTTPRVGTPLTIAATQPHERGRELLARALSDTADPDQILADEFEAYLHDNGNVTIVLPGVIDLSTPNFGYDEEHHSLRDLDQHALKSATSPGLAHNAYAQRVSEWAALMIEADVITPGAQTAIIGHSYGSDTAFDLAFDEHFNGKLVTVSHVFGAGYELTSRLEHVPANTSAVAANNIYDVVALAEGYAQFGKMLSTGRVRLEVIEEAADTITDPVNSNIEQLETDLEHHGLATLNLAEIPDLNLAGDIYAPIEPNGLHISFEGGADLSGVGHHQREYQEFLADADNEHFTAFLEDLDHAGFTGNAIAVSVDVSRPNPRARDAKGPREDT